MKPQYITSKNETAPRKLEVGLQKTETAFQNFETPPLCGKMEPLEETVGNAEMMYGAKTRKI